MFNLILFGPPGSGKGTQSANIIHTFHLHHISTGDLLRDEVSRETDLGKEAKKSMDEGRLVSDEIVIGMIGGLLDKNPDAKGFIFDGFPRTKAQAEALDALLAARHTAIHVLLSLEVPEDELKRRLINRGNISGRSDDNEAVIEKRIIEYKNKTEAVAEHYDQQNKLRRIKGDGTIDATFNLLKAEIEELIQPA